MKLTFSWAERAGKMEPVCHSAASATSDEIRLLINLLMDDGGVGYESTLQSLEEELAIVDAVLAGRSDSGEWEQETWGARVSRDSVEMFSVYTETYSQKIGIQHFRKALAAWLAFLKAGPDEQKVLEVEL